MTDEIMKQMLKEDPAIVLKSMMYSLGMKSFRPDIVVFFKEPHMTSTNPVSNPPIAGYAIEIENDIQWNFAQSLQQIKKYLQGFYPIAIIPKIYSRYKTLYELEGIKVWLWSAERIWECMKCGDVSRSSRTAIPKCNNNKCKGRELRLMGISNFTLESDEETIEIL